MLPGERCFGAACAGKLSAVEDADIHSGESLAGQVVVAIGLRYDDRMVDGARRLLHAGAQVALFDIGGAYGDTDPLPEPEQLVGEFAGRAVYVTGIGGDDLRSIFFYEEDPWAIVFGAAQAQCGRPPDHVWLGQWWGFLDSGLELIPALMDRLQEVGGGELVVAESPASSADQAVRWMDRWLQLTPRPQVRTTVLREPVSLAPDARATTGSLAEVLLAFGWTLGTIEAANAAAAERRSQGLDCLAGRRWAAAGVLGADNRMVVVGDAFGLGMASTESFEQVYGQYEVVDLRASGVPGLLVRLPAEEAFGVAKTDEDVVDGVCLQGTPEVFALDVAYRPLTVLDLASGVVAFGQPEDVVGKRGGCEVTLHPGLWTVEIARGDGETWAVRLRPYRDSDAELLPREPDDYCDIFDFDEWGDPIYEGDTVLDWGSDPPTVYTAGSDGRTDDPGDQGAEDGVQ